jgi:hypothetical protein
MPSLYDSLDKLNQFCTTNELPEFQREFLKNIINGDQTRASLSDIVRFRKTDQLASLQTSIDQMLSNTSYISWHKPYFNFGYISLLKSILSNIKGMQKAAEFIEKFGVEKPERYKKYVTQFDSLYATTKNKYQGTIMLPIMQGLDVRLGDSDGECFGFIAEWAAQIQQQKKPFGVPVDSIPPFAPVTLNTLGWQTYPDLNHLAVLTPNMPIYQDLQNDESELTKKLSSQLVDKNQQFKFEKFKADKFYNSISQIAEELVAYTDEDSKKIYNINVRGYSVGHALGFCKINNKYHFMDSNAGWTRFENANDFKQWLPFYFKKLGYDKNYAEYGINTISFSPSGGPIEPKDKLGAFSISLLIILSPIIIPIVLIYTARIFFDHFVIRGIKYLAFDFKNKSSSAEEEPLLVEAASTIKPSDQSLAKSLDPLDLAVKQRRKMTSNSTQQSSLGTITSMLDIPLKDLAEVQKRAENNEEFKRTKTYSLFAKTTDKQSLIDPTPNLEKGLR